MTAEATAASVPRTERARPAIHRAGRVVVAAIGIGLVGQLLFFDAGIGINAPVALMALLGAGWLIRRPGTRLNAAEAWLAPAALVFAAFAALRADRSIVALDLLTALGLAGAALLAFGGREVVRTTMEPLLRLALSGIGWVLAGVLLAAPQALRALPAAGRRMDGWRRAMPVLRGLLIALPVLLVFVNLFSAADAVFAGLVDDLVSVDLELGDVAGRAMLAAFIAWFATGALALAATAPSPDEAVGDALPGLRLGTTEAVTVLVSVVALFAVFVVLQAAYLFGGLDTLAATGLTYAEYARRGFFELVAVAILAGGLVVVIDRVARRRTRLLVAAALLLTVLTGVVLASAALRMRLYQEAYGWTELRLYVLATIILLAVALAVLAGALLADRVRWIGHVALALGLVVGLGLNVIGPVRFITEQNVARALDPGLVPAHGASGLDASYLGSLDLDAVPPLVAALPELPEAQAERLREELRWQLDRIRDDGPDSAWQAWNAGRAAARASLEAAERRGELDDR